VWSQLAACCQQSRDVDAPDSLCGIHERDVVTQSMEYVDVAFIVSFHTSPPWVHQRYLGARGCLQRVEVTCTAVLTALVLPWDCLLAPQWDHGWWLDHAPARSRDPLRAGKSACGVESVAGPPENALEAVGAPHTGTQSLAASQRCRTGMRVTVHRQAKECWASQ